MPDASPIMGEEHQDEREAVGHRRDDEEIGRDDLADVIPQECAPVLRCVGRNINCHNKNGLFSRHSRDNVQPGGDVDGPA